jgi:hypothetical protein
VDGEQRTLKAQGGKAGAEKGGSLTVPKSYSHSFAQLKLSCISAPSSTLTSLFCKSPSSLSFAMAENGLKPYFLHFCESR